MRLRLERRQKVQPWQYVAIPVLSVAAALLVGAVFLSLTGHSPAVVYPAMLRASFASTFGISDTLVSATPLIFTGLAAAVAFRYNVYNIGAEGQLYIGAVFAAGAGLAVADGVPGAVAIGVILLAGAVGGMAWVAVPALARAWLGTSEIITTLLLNYVALSLLRYLIFGSASFWRDPTATNFPQGRPLPETAWFPEIGVTRIHLGLAVGLVAAVAVYGLLRRTRVGYELAVFGDSPAAARYAGIPVKRTILVILLLSGALAGLAGASEIGGRAHRLDPAGLSVGFGYAGIIVAALARYNPLALVLVAVLLGGVDNAGTALQSIAGARVPAAISTMLQGAILLFVLGGELHVRYRVRFRRPSADTAAGGFPATTDSPAEPPPPSLADTAPTREPGP